MKKAEQQHPTQKYQHTPQAPYSLLPQIDQPKTHQSKINIFSTHLWAAGEHQTTRTATEVPFERTQRKFAVFTRDEARL